MIQLPFVNSYKPIHVILMAVKEGNTCVKKFDFCDDFFGCDGGNTNGTQNNTCIIPE